MESAQTTQAEPQARLAVRRDLHGNTNLLGAFLDANGIQA
jgi:hypothetical protein